ncbi:hypothetical protein [Leadbettera azotonutricia]|uniref:Uncharacterized protein n=1 Tax=Leadbettera azotonutricia (strain ATCC BAA-888 / DSM 13862 / ZAS-9) TaxID=545695 RepID=F5YFP2_LEAAZ|nr:hypothetical protein [Leadbettera azotonutricia]AEF82192.1 hypothetical protein TREAZ_2478 [Leadbettera azotonutricia ZAS-9]
MTMEQTQTLPQIRAALMDRAKVLRELSDQAFRIENQIKSIASSLLDLEKDRIEGGKPRIDAPKLPSNIIPFPGPMTKTQPVKGKGQQALPFLVPIPGEPEKQLPETIPDFRPLLQRDGLILLSWDKRVGELGERYTAYWVTSTGPCRYYASKAMDRRSFAAAMPDHKSYAAEDGIEFYGQANPCYVVHVAPELMMSNPAHLEQRSEHIKKLRDLGTKANFEYEFLLKNRKKKMTSAKRGA